MILREKLAKLAGHDPTAFPLIDDYAASPHPGRSEEAAAPMVRQARATEAKGFADRSLYTTYANLGSFLIHGSSTKAMAGDAAARKLYREGVEFLRHSIALNPDAHFGRGRWHLAIAEFLLGAMNDPHRLKESDCLGNQLDAAIEDLLNREGNWPATGYGCPTNAAFSQGRMVERVPEFFVATSQSRIPRWVDVSPIRGSITKIGWESDDQKKLVPFDEPMLGPIGEWRQGSGASPHLALGHRRDHAACRPARHCLVGISVGAIGQPVLAG